VQLSQGGKYENIKVTIKIKLCRSRNGGEMMMMVIIKAKKRREERTKESTATEISSSIMLFDSRKAIL